MKTHVDLIIQPRWLITVNAKNQVLEHHSLVVNADKIVDILPNKDVYQYYSATQELYLEDHALLPGFINAHTHTPMSLMRGLADDLPLMTWLNDHIWPAEKAIVSPQMVADGAELAIAEMIASGTTFINDLYFHMEGVAKVAHLAGIRANVAQNLFSFPGLAAKKPEDYITQTEALIENVVPYPLVSVALGPHSPYGTDDDVLKKVKELSMRHHLPIHTHLHESRDEMEQYADAKGMRPLAGFKQLGLCSSKLQVAHMAHVVDEDIEIMKRTGMHVIHCPESNMKLASGVCPAQKLLNAGINVALATDGAASNNDLDMIGEMRSAAFLAKITAGNPEALSADTVLRMATINGAKALGFADVTGSLEVGKSADMVAIDLNDLSTMPVYHPVSQIVYAATRHQVSDVWVAGRQLLKEKVLQTMDLSVIKDKVTYWQKQIREVFA